MSIWGAVGGTGGEGGEGGRLACDGEGRGGTGGGGLGVLVAAAENGATSNGTSCRRTGLVVELMPFRSNPDRSRLVVSFRRGLPLG
jgi:hypothetical protein